MTSLIQITIDADTLGSGVYDLLDSAGEAAPVSFGMLPALFMELVERQIRERVLRLAQAVWCTHLIRHKDLNAITDDDALANEYLLELELAVCEPEPAFRNAVHKLDNPDLETFARCVDPVWLRHHVQDLTHRVHIAILNAASRKGRLLV